MDITNLPDDHVIYEVKITMAHVRELLNDHDVTIDEAGIDANVLSNFTQALEDYVAELMLELLA